MSTEKSVGDRAFALDLGTIVVISAAICAYAHDLARMSVLVPVVLGLRTALFLALPDEQRDTSRRGELALLAVATLLGAFNDWSSVVRHRIYDYTVPTDLGRLSTIPLWMLLYWGMILRFVLTLCHYRRLALPPAPRGLPGLDVGAKARLAVLLGVVVVTRQCIYRLYDRPILSFVPFVVALVAFLLVVRPDPRRRGLLAGVLVLGPAVEVLYIQVGHLHAYRLGVLFGVPIWIALWWGLAVLVWEELGTRLQRGLESLLA